MNKNKIRDLLNEVEKEESSSSESD